MEQSTSYLAQPLAICGKKIKNRIVVPPMADFGMTEQDGLVNNRHIERYGAYARGGAGFIIVEACAVTKMPEPRNTIGLFSDDCLAGLKKLAQATTENGAVALVQLMETGLSTMPYHAIAEIPEKEFLHYKDDFIRAAVRCKEAGFDGIELHAAHGMYLNQVIETSERQDGYGGSFEGRVRVLAELVREIKELCGESFIVAVRFGNPDYEELVQTAITIEQAGGDLLDVSTGMGGYGNIPPQFQFDSKIYAASLVKDKVSIPVIGVGNIQTGEQAEKVLEYKYADMVAIGRGHLCDPAWASKALHGEQPILCRKCKPCMWYIDGGKCPVHQGGAL